MKLHLGSGDKRIPGFTNVDIRPLPEVDEMAKAEDLYWVYDDTVDMIYACHLLEHYGRHQIGHVLKEWHRVLKPGGTLRLSVPNFAACVRRYMRGFPLDQIMGLLYGGQDDDWNHHKVIFDAKSLSAALEDAGFSDPREWDWTKTEHHFVDDYSQAYLPHMEKIGGQLMSLNMEATA